MNVRYIFIKYDSMEELMFWDASIVLRISPELASVKLRLRKLDLTEVKNLSRLKQLAGWQNWNLNVDSFTLASKLLTNSQYYVENKTFCDIIQSQYDTNTKLTKTTWEISTEY